MKSINESQYKLLCKSCDKFLNNNDTIERHANAFLNVIRAHPIFLKNYHALFCKYEVNYFYHLAKNLSRHLIVGFYKFINLIYRNYFLGDSIINDKRAFQNIFISHFLNSSFNNHKSDFYFYDLPQKVSKKSSLILYINYTDQSSKKTKFNKIDNKTQSILLPKYLPLRQEIKIKFQLFREAIKILKLNSSTKFERRLKYLAAVSSFSSATYFNYRLPLIIQHYVKKNSIKRIFTTYEGQSWERLVFSLARKVNDSVQCIGYQHALLFNNQYSIKRKLDKTFEPDYLMFSGKKGMEIFKDIKYLPPERLLLFGSKRLEFNKKSIKKTILNKKKTFLILPEGDLIECIPLTKFAINLAKEYNGLEFIIRFHPITKIKQLYKECPELKRDLPNLKLSKDSLENDLKLSDFAIYRGTTTIIRAIQNELIPLYYRRINEISIDPLIDFKKERTHLDSTEDLNLFLNKTMEDFERIKKDLIDYTNDFFTPINYSIVNKIK